MDTLNGTDNAEQKLDERAMTIARDTLTGDIRDIILTDMKDRKTSLPWNLRGEEAQQQIIDQVTRFAEGIVTRAVQIVASGGRKVIRAQLTKVTVKDGIKAELELLKSDEQRHQLMDSVGTSVMVVIADPEIYQGDREPVTPTRDQPEIFDSETGEIKDPPPKGKRKPPDQQPVA